jgi:NADH:ubiquinone reductase (H+-translocating)
MNNEQIRIIVVGGGFAGLNLLKRLRNDHRFHITLVDKNNYHFFPPLLYQIGMAFIEPSNITYPFRRFFQEQKNIDFHYGKFIRVVPEKNQIETETSVLSYDHLVLAIGTEANYFGMDHVKSNSLPLKTIDDAINLRNHLLLNFEKACRTKDPEERKWFLTVVIAGGGPTGVEVAGMLAEMIHSIAPKEYPEINRRDFRIYLIQSGPVLLNPMSVKAQTEALKVLTSLGVNILLNVRVKDYINGSVLLSNGESIRTNALLWTSGVVAREVKGILAEQLGEGRRIFVDAFNKVKGSANIFAIGDISLSTEDKKYPKGHPQLAQVAIQQGKLLAVNFRRSLKNEEWKPFEYKDKGTMAIISKFKAVADLPDISFKGFLAWIVWLFVHLLPIASFRNKVSLILDWTWAFLTNDPTLRLIIRPSSKEFAKENSSTTPSPIQEKGKMVSSTPSG